MSLWSALFGNDSFAVYASDDEREAYSNLVLRAVREGVGHIYTIARDDTERRAEQRDRLDALDDHLSSHADPKMRRAWRYWRPWFYGRMDAAEREAARSARVGQIMQTLTSASAGSA